jgi:hypothetical protein
MHVACIAKEVAAITQWDSRKAFWNSIHLEIPRKLICCRKPGYADPSAIGASKNFNPTIAGHPR